MPMSLKCSFNQPEIKNEPENQLFHTFDTFRLEFFLETGNILKLGVPIRMTWPHSLFLQCLTSMITLLLEQPRDDVPTDWRSQFAHASGNQTPGEIGPFHSNPHWIACGVIFENLEKVGLNGQILFNQGLASTPFFRMRS